jgi:hypothetical protein
MEVNKINPCLQVHIEIKSLLFIKFYESYYWWLFNVYDEMKNLARRLEEIGIRAILPRQYRGMLRKHKEDILTGKINLSEEDYKRMGEVEKWFFEQIKNADYIVIYNKNIRNGEPIEGYVGINPAIDIGCAIGNNKEVIIVSSD